MQINSQPSFKGAIICHFDAFADHKIVDLANMQASASFTKTTEANKVLNPAFQWNYHSVFADSDKFFMYHIDFNNDKPSLQSLERRMTAQLKRKAKRENRNLIIHLPEMDHSTFQTVIRRFHEATAGGVRMTKELFLKTLEEFRK